MSHIVAQVNLERVTGVPADRTVNSFHFEGFGVAADPSSFAGILTKVANFYTLAPVGSTVSVGRQMASTMSVAGHTIKLYDMKQPKPRSPVAVSNFTISPGSSAIPAECAICLSFRGGLVSGTDPTRRRGRIFIGPLDSGSVITGGDARPIQQRIDDLLNAGAALLAANTDQTLPAGSRWVVDGLAPTVPKPAPPGDQPRQLTPISYLWVDNAFDTQRRRGAQATARFSRTG